MFPAVPPSTTTVCTRLAGSPSTFVVQCAMNASRSRGGKRDLRTASGSCSYARNASRSAVSTSLSRTVFSMPTESGTRH